MAAREHPGWPVELHRGAVGLRPLRMRDAATWSRMRIIDEAWLAPWEPSARQSWADRHSVSAYVGMLGRLRAQARAGTVLPFAVTFEDQLVGQLTVANIVRGALRSGQIGYWIGHSWAGRGIIPIAVALTTDHCFGAVGLHRVQIDIRPENGPSRRVVEKLRFREEARFSRYLDIDGHFRDHIGYALTVEDCPGGLVQRLPKSTDLP